VVTGGGGKKEETNVPRLLLIPLVLFEKIRAEGRPLMPHEVLKLVMALLKSVINEVVVSAWSLIAQWCLTAAQRDASGDSWVAFFVKAITEGEDKDLSRWLEQRLSSTLGARPTIGSPAGGAIGAHAQGLPAQHIGAVCCGTGQRGGDGADGMGPVGQSYRLVRWGPWQGVQTGL
jgi:hypothetical protein